MSMKSDGNDGSDNEFARMFEQSIKDDKKKRFSTGDKVNAEILVLGKEEVFVSLGSNKDGMVHRRDLLDADGNVPYKVGDKIDLYIIQVKGSEIRLSPKVSSKYMSEGIQDAFQSRTPIEGKVAELVNGGFRVQIRGKLAFCPISQMDNKRIEQPELYLNQRFQFRVTKFEEGGRNIVVSRRQLLEEERKISDTAFALDRKPGDVVSGRVTRLEKFGAFIEIAPGLDGLAHISELSWSRVGDPSEVLTQGQEVTAKILKIETIDGNKMRISLSLKQAGTEPWANMPSHIIAGQKVQGKVTRFAKFGAFVELAPGIEGLLPLSEMSQTQRVNRAEDVVKAGEVLSVLVKNIDVTGHRISLSLKDAGVPGAESENDDWKGYSAQQNDTKSKQGFGSLGDKLKAALNPASANAKKNK